jgi:hypothetical protein
MAHDAWEAALLCPAAIAIHNHSNMARQQRSIEIGGQFTR